MKTVNTVLKVLTALAAVAGAIYVVAAYGDKIVAWAKKILGRCECCCDPVAEECDCADTEEEAGCCCCDAEPAAEEAPAEEAPAEEVPAADGIIADDKDFEG